MEEGAPAGYEIARQRILEVVGKKPTTLDLGGLELVSLPPELDQLTTLITLNLNDNQLTALPTTFAKLAELQILTLRGNQFTGLPAQLSRLTNLRVLDAGDNSIKGMLTSFPQLTELETLSLHGNQLTELPPQLTRLARLRTLDLGDNELSSVPDDIAQLTRLERLDLSNNRLTDLPPAFYELVTLRTLALGDNQLKRISAGIARLINLESLDLTGNQIGTLPTSIGRLTKLSSLWVSRNRLEELPRQLAELPATLDLRVTHNPLREPLLELDLRGVPQLFTYLRSLDSAQPQYEAKILLVGEGNVGKTSLVAALQDRPFVENRPTTHGIEIGQVHLNHPQLDLQIALNTWDFGGQEVYRITHQFFFSRRALYLLVWRPREGQEENAIEGWIKRIRLRVGQHARILIVATYGDEHSIELDYPGLKRKFGDLLLGHYTIDNKSGNGIRELRNAIAVHAAQLPQMGSLLSVPWLTARNEILARPEPQIGYDLFQSTCERHGLTTQEAETLASLLHDLGHIIHYAEDEGLRDVVVLQPEWLTKAIGYVLEDRPTRSARGVLHHERLKEIWPTEGSGPVYPARYHPYFLRLMEKFDVSYRLADEEASLVAQLLPFERPELRWDRRPMMPGFRSLTLVCRLAEPAPGLIAWLTVRHHRFSIGQHWRHGVFLVHWAYASEGLLELLDDRQLTLTVRAPSPEYFLGVLRDSISELIQRRWQGLSYDFFVPCPAVNRDKLPCQGLFLVQSLLMCRERSKLTMDCPVCTEPQNVAALLTAFPQPTMPLRNVLDEVGSTQDLPVDTNLAQGRAANAASSVRRVLKASSIEINDCPRLFTLVPMTTTRWGRTRAWHNHYQLNLWCEHAGYEHTWPRARYEVQRSRAWLRKVAPYALLVNQTLEVAAPIARKEVSALVSEQHIAIAKKDIAEMRALLDGIPDYGDELDLSLYSHTELTRGEAAGLRALRSALLEIDRAQSFGGLRRVLTASGDLLWVCPRHYPEYDPGLPVLPT
jgi:internalin A